MTRRSCNVSAFLTASAPNRADAVKFNFGVALCCFPVFRFSIPFTLRPDPVFSGPRLAEKIQCCCSAVCFSMPGVSPGSWYSWSSPSYRVMYSACWLKNSATGPNGPSCACGPPPLSVWDFGLLQVRRLFHQRLQHPHRAVPPAAPCGPAHRHQLLHLPDSELRHRRIPGRCDCPAESH